MEFRTSTPHQPLDGTEVGVDRREGTYWRRPEVACTSKRRSYDINVVGAERLMNTARAYIRDHPRQVAGDRPLNVQVPLHHIIPMGLGFDVSLTKRCRPQKRKCRR